jgi:hypothetical protein
MQEKYLNHTNSFLQKHGYFKKNDKLFKFVRHPLHKKKLAVEVVKDKEKVLKEMYNNPLYRANGRDSFYSKVREYYLISRQECFDFLKKQEGYQLHLQQPKQSSLKPILVKAINKYWQIDLVIFKSIKKDNDGNTVVFTCIDCFSKYAWAIELKNKSAISCVEAMETILKDNFERTGEYPERLQSDNSKEFHSKTFNEFLNKFEIKHIYSQVYLPQNNAFIERFNRTLKNAIFLNFTIENTRNYTNFLYDIVTNYNHTINSTKTKPVLMHKKNKESLTQKYQNIEKAKEFQRNNRYDILEIGDTVRKHKLTLAVERKKQKMEKKYTIQWSRELYKVVKVLYKTSDTLIPEYILDNGKQYKRYQLQKILK